MNEWIDDLSDQSAAGQSAVLVTVAAVRGSAPREVGAKMVVTASDTIGTIGGGQLEYQCTRVAVDMLDESRVATLERFPLGPSLGQCCGGVVDVLFEPVDAMLPGWLRDLKALHGQREPLMLVTRIGGPPDKRIVTAETDFGDRGTTIPEGMIRRARERLVASMAAAVVDGDYFIEPVTGTDFDIAVFGAGHVGSAVVSALSKLDANIRWVDSRRRIFRGDARNVRQIETDTPPLEVAAMPPGSFYLVMTHSHALDFEVCERILSRDDAAYCGLIGSKTKRRRFEKRFREAGLTEAQIAALVCPIGVDGISGKRPAEIAVAVAAELLQARESLAVAAEPLPDNVRPIRR